MSYRNATYVIFDGDKDMWAYAYMLGWKSNEKVDFNFGNAHDLDTMTSNAQQEAYVKSRLKDRMAKSSQVVVLVGESTKSLYRFVRWELNLALELGLPIIVANLNGLRQQDNERCPPIIRDKCVVHVDFRMKIIRHALDSWPNEFRRLGAIERLGGARYYNASVYKGLGL